MALKRSCNPWSHELRAIMPKVIKFLVDGPTPDICVTKTLGNDVQSIMQTSWTGKKAVDQFVHERRAYWQDMAGITAWKSENVEFVDKKSPNAEYPFDIWPCERMIVLDAHEVVSFSGGHGFDGPFVHQDGTPLTVVDHIRHFTTDFYISSFLFRLEDWNALSPEDKKAVIEVVDNLKIVI